MDIGAAYIYLKKIHLIAFVQSACHINIFLKGKAADVGHNPFVKHLFKLGQLLGYHLVHTGILKSHGVEHAGRALGRAGCGVAESGFLCGSLKRKCPEAVYIVKLGKLISISKGAACRYYRIIEGFPAKIYL